MLIYLSIFLKFYKKRSPPWYQNIGLTLNFFFPQLTQKICSTEFAADIRHALFPKAFIRSRKLPLPSLIAALLSMRVTSQQVVPDSFFGGLGDDIDLHRGISKYEEQIDRKTCVEG